MNTELGKYLAEAAGQTIEEHGTWKRGDHITEVEILDTCEYPKSENVYLDSGGKGLVLIEVTRKRVYADGKWEPRYATTKYLCGFNETGTAFAHALSKSCKFVGDAVQWMWHGKLNNIIARQGDIALVKSKCNSDRLPYGHIIIGGVIIYDQHPPIRQPLYINERIICARRTYVYANAETRD